VVVFSAVARFCARRLAGRASTEPLFVARHQLRALMEISERGAGDPVFDRIRIERAIRFPDTSVGERMVPAGEMVAVPHDAPMEVAIETVQRSGYTTLPVYEGNVSNVVGTVTLGPWDVMEPGAREIPLAERLEPPAYVSPHQSLEEMISVLRARRDGMAVVVDEYGTAMGIITSEDVMEAVVGEIDVGFEWAASRERGEREYEQIGEGAYRMDGRLSISEVNDLLGLDLPTTEYHTVGGLIGSRLRRLARTGDAVVVDGYRFVVEETTERSIRRVRVVPSGGDPR
jgi:CBS domain containing-hemolysin-like protein